MNDFERDFEDRDRASEDADWGFRSLRWEPAAAHRVAEQERREVNEGRQRCQQSAPQERR
ncbi:hypothetical protein JOD31_001319 [Methylopila capsulata]|uniref:Uncharacterized protein n=1 Tax=Methylopila capsulata TaxID=61654 RepID=A0A9W6IPN7_9HYPH|nr:hypothetical protein [Methylopila capsulata]MBM7851094.1 hypothetical protein [Methylopila capsulata]GLK54151.1 hypothetical protein GCM10008170_01700 [Methylopila capsulata]